MSNNIKTYETLEDPQPVIAPNTKFLSKEIMTNNRRERILFIMQLPPPVHGVSVMSQLIKNSRLINEAFECDYVNLATATGINDLQKNSVFKYVATLRISLQVLSCLLRKRYSKVYITLFPFGFSFIKDSFIIFLCRLFGYRPLLHLHTYGFKKSSRSSSSWKSIYKFVFRNTRVICLSGRLIEDIEELYKGEVYILANGIPRVNFTNTYNSQQKEPVKLLYLSNLIKGKGVLVLMEAVSLVKKQGYAFHLRIAGEEHDVTYEMLARYARENKLEEDVSFAGPKFGEEKYKEFREAGIFILPSNYDTFGLVLLEAMQFGVPCISTNMGAIPEVLGDGRGTVIPHINAEELAAAIICLIKNPGTRKEMSERSFSYFEANYTDHVFEKEMFNILNSQPSVVDHRLVNNIL